MTVYSRICHFIEQVMLFLLQGFSAFIVSTIYDPVEAYTVYDKCMQTLCINNVKSMQKKSNCIEVYENITPLLTLFYT